MAATLLGCSTGPTAAQFRVQFCDPSQVLFRPTSFRDTAHFFLALILNPIFIIAGVRSGAHAEICAGVNADFGASAPSPSRLSFGVRHPLADARGSVLEFEPVALVSCALRVAQEAARIPIKLVF